MNKRIYISLIILQSLTFMTFKAKAAIEAHTLPYDSIHNYVGADPQQYIGQQLCVKGLPDNSQKLGYDGFVINYKKDDVILNDRKNVYKVGDGYSTQYDALVGRCFNVVDVIAHPQTKNNPKEYARYSYLKLQDQSIGETVYYRYDSQGSNLSFPFIVIGFYEKRQQQLINKTYIFSQKALGNPVNVNNNQAVKHNAQGMQWKCFGVTLDPQKYLLSLLLQNSYAERIIVPYEIVDPYSDGGQKAYTVEEYNTYLKKFGKINFNNVLNNVVKTGMTKEMCRLAWGDPLEMTKNGTVETWNYSSGTLVFRANVLSRIQ